MKFVAPPVTPKGLARRVPPAIFPPILGLFALGLGWRQASLAFDLPPGLAEAFLGAVTLVYLVALGAYTLKVMHRPAVVIDELRVISGRLGLSALMGCIYLLATTLSPYLPNPARAGLWIGFAAHLGLIGLILRGFAKGPHEARRYSPAGHLYFVAPMIGGLAAAQAGYDYLALAVMAVTLPLAGFIWSCGVDRLWRQGMAVPLRPLLALHLFPAAVAGLAAKYLGLETLALMGAGVAAVMVIALASAAPAVIRAGFSSLWAAVTFPLAMTAWLWISLGGLWRVAGGVGLVVATLVILPIAFKLGISWISGQLAVKTNAAIS